MAEHIFLTEEGRVELTAELRDLIDVRQPRLAALLAEARRENTEREEDTLLAQGREELARVEQRIRELEHLLKIAVTTGIGNGLNDHRIHVGSRVVVRDDEGDESSYTIVTSMEAHPSTGRISEQSPVGKALLGHQAGDNVVVQTPAGEQHLIVVSLG